MSAAGRLLGIDHGKVRIGLAVSDPQCHIASPLQTYTRRDPDQDARFFRELVEREEIGLVVIGLPVHLDGHEGEQATAARKFGSWLGEVTGLPIVFFDERFTTHEAEGFLQSAGLTKKKRQARRDRVAAQIMLQAFLDAGCPDQETPGPIG